MPVAGYTFKIEGREYRGKTDGQFAVGDPIGTEYDSHDPSRNREAGDRSRIVGGLLVLAFAIWAAYASLDRSQSEALPPSKS